MIDLPPALIAEVAITYTIRLVEGKDGVERWVVLASKDGKGEWKTEAQAQAEADKRNSRG